MNGTQPAGYELYHYKILLPHLIIKEAKESCINKLIATGSIFFEKPSNINP